MAKRLFDLLAATVALIALSPILLMAVVGIRLTSPGPVFYRAQRVGRRGSLFVMHKFRTMHVAPTSASPITAANDRRVFPFGRILRTLKIDELPQLLNVLIGQMSIVGPRPEDPAIVQRYYGPLGLETLSVRPGLASPGSVYNYTHGERLIDDADPETSYVNRLLPIKLALELVYLRHQSLLRDTQVIVRTAMTIALIGVGKKTFADPPEMAEAQTILATARGQLVNSLTHPM